MPSLTFAKSALGAIVDVSLLPSAAQRGVVQAGMGAVMSIRLKMLIDTGADHTAADEARIAAWGLYPSTFYVSQSMGGRNTVPVYELAVAIVSPSSPFAWEIDPLLVTARSSVPFAGLPCAGVIGRDILDQGFFIYNGVASQCTLAY